jgi:hypothetical protein
MSFTSCVVLTCFAGYLIFCHIKVSQVKNLSTPLGELIETIKMDISFAIFGAPEKKSSMGTTWKTLEDHRTIIITRPGTKPTRFHSFAK